MQTEGVKERAGARSKRPMAAKQTSGQTGRKQDRPSHRRRSLKSFPWSFRNLPTPMCAPPKLHRTNQIYKASHPSLDKNMKLPKRLQENTKSLKEPAWKAGKSTYTKRKSPKTGPMPLRRTPRNGSENHPKSGLLPSAGHNKALSGPERPKDHKKWLAEAPLGPPRGTSKCSAWRHLASTKRFIYTKVHERRKGRGEDLVLALPRDVQDHQKYAFR